MPHFCEQKTFAFSGSSGECFHYIEWREGTDEMSNVRTDVNIYKEERINTRGRKS